MVEQIALHHGLPQEDLPDDIGDIAAAYLNRQPIEPTRARKPQSAQSRQRPEMRLLELFESWKAGNDPSSQTAHEYEQAVCDFVDFVGDIPVAEIINDDLLNYRDEVARLPKSMPRADRELTFTERLAKHAGSSAFRVSPATIKKRVGGVQALLSFAKEQRWIAKNEGRDVAIVGYTKSERRRRPFEEDEMQRLFSSRLFVQPASWRMDRCVSELTLYWLFLIGLTTGARLEEVGQAAMSDVKTSGQAMYIDVDDYALDGVDEPKSVKTDGSRRLVPIHDQLISLGFDRYRDALAAAGHTRLFPDLKLNQFDKRTKEASRIANRYIDSNVSKDERLAFHSLRHGFKDLALEAGITDRIVDQICGHAPTTVGGKYGKGVRLRVLHAALHQVDWSFLDWSALLAGTADLDWTDALTRATPA